MSFTMHSSSQGYQNQSADLYSSRSYGDHLTDHVNINYSSYLGRDDPYNLSLSSAYPIGDPHQSINYVAPNSSMPPLHTYPSAAPMSHFSSQQPDVYASCVTPPRNHSYPAPAPVLANMPSSVSPRQTANSKSYWNCESQSQLQQSQNHCYPSNNSHNSSHKSSPPTWTRSPNVLSSPSTTPSPIPCPSTPHHFSSSPHHTQSHSETHKPYNGIMNNSSLPSNGNAGSNINCNSNPLQSLQKMVQIESENTDIRSPFETSSTVPIVSVNQPQPQQQAQHPQSNSQPQHPPHSLSGLESEASYPTYYNLDQNRTLCATPQTPYSNINAQSLNSVPFSPTLKDSQEIRPHPIQNNYTKVQENGYENGDISLCRVTSLRYQNKICKENNFVNNNSCSTDTCSNGSPAQSSKIASIPESLIQTDTQTHDSINSFRGSETTANSRDSVKSTDSDVMSSYAVSQCSTPNNNWKVNSGVQSSEFRQNSFSTNSHKSWWPENAQPPNRSFTPQNTSDCSQYSSPNVNYPSSHQISQSNSSISPNQSWTHQSPAAISTQNSQMMDCSYQSQMECGVIKKKRGRPFGSKNRRNQETAQTADAYKRRRKTAFVDIGINTNLSIDVQGSFPCEESCPVLEAKHSLPVRRKKTIGPVIRIDKTNIDSQLKYAIVNTFKLQEDDKDMKAKAQLTKSNIDMLNPPRKNCFTKKCASLNSNSNVCDKNWLCVLCHKGPHFKGLGDLYGPYFVELDKSKSSSLCENGINERQEEIATPERRSLRKRSESSDESKPKIVPNCDEVHLQEMSKVNLEVWIHEDCIVWSNNVYLDGTKIRNLEPAIRESFDNICTKCKLPGATLGCIFKNCNVSPLHYLCAKEKDCDLDEDKFILSCSKHKKQRITLKVDGEATLAEPLDSVDQNPLPKGSN